MASDLDDQEMKEEFVREFGCTHHYPPDNQIEQLKGMVGPVIDDSKKRSGPRSEEVMAIMNEALGTNY